MLNYLSTADLKSRSVSRSHMRSSSHELAKIHMQNQGSRQVFGVDDLQRQQDQTEGAYDMASYLRLQIA